VVSPGQLIHALNYPHVLKLVQPSAPFVNSNPTGPPHTRCAAHWEYQNRDNPDGNTGSCILLALYVLVSMWGRTGQRERTQPRDGLKGR
jgi:hypothetical protein